MGVLTLDQIGPDGVLVVVDWDAMKVGSSVFVPCINTTEALKQVGGIFTRRGWEMRVVIRAENDIWGVRIWRSA
jgi:hypothetical protein